MPAYWKAGVVFTHLTRLGVPGLSQVNPRCVTGWTKSGPFRFTLNQIAQILNQKSSQSGSKIEQSGSNWAHLVQKLTNLVQIEPIWFKTGPIWFKLGPSGSVEPDWTSLVQTWNNLVRKMDPSGSDLNRNASKGFAPKA